MEEAEYCNRLALMSKGRIIALGTPGELKKDWMKDSVVDLECDQLMQAAEVLQKEAVFSEVAVFGNLLHLVTADADTAIQTANEKLSEAGIRLFRIEVTTPSLEDVFVTLTAKDRNSEG
jgi:ABC-2 type transport system ATP-binding protein